MDHADHSGSMEGMAHDHSMFHCDGEPIMTEGGSWIGHLLPGVVFCVWALHWLQGTYRTYFASQRTKGQEYVARTTYSFGGAPAIWESVLKFVLPVIGVSLEMYFAHRGGYRTLICPIGTQRAGHFYGDHVGNWQHAAMYPPFIMAGLVDLAGYEVELPPGAQQCFLFLAFLCEALLMGLHKKHTPLDIAVHSVLFYTMIATAVAILVEMLYPRNFMASCGRVAALLVQAAWFFAATHIIFDHVPAWDESGGNDMAPAMMVPVVFVGIIVAVAFFMFVVYVGYSIYYQLMDAHMGAAYERTSFVEDERGDRFSSRATCAPAALAGDTCCQV